MIMIEQRHTTFKIKDEDWVGFFEAGVRNGWCPAHMSYRCDYHLWHGRHDRVRISGIIIDRTDARRWGLSLAYVKGLAYYWDETEHNLPHPQSEFPQVPLEYLDRFISICMAGPFEVCSNIV